MDRLQRLLYLLDEDFHELLLADFGSVWVAWFRARGLVHHFLQCLYRQFLPNLLCNFDQIL